MTGDGGWETPPGELQDLVDQAEGQGEQQPQDHEEGGPHDDDAERDQDDLSPGSGSRWGFGEFTIRFVLFDVLRADAGSR